MFLRYLLVGILHLISFHIKFFILGVSFNFHMWFNNLDLGCTIILSLLAQVTDLTDKFPSPVNFHTIFSWTSVTGIGILMIFQTIWGGSSCWRSLVFQALNSLMNLLTFSSSLIVDSCSIEILSIRGDSSIQISSQNLILLPSPRHHQILFLRRYLIEHILPQCRGVYSFLDIQEIIFR